jgi:hypothetical protein
MAGTWKWYGNGLLNLAKGLIDLDTDTFKMILTTSAYTPDQDTHDFRNDVTNEVVGTGYTAGGATLAGVSVTYDAATNEVRISWTDPTWPTSTITARTAVIYKSRGGASSADELLAYCTEAGDIASTAGTFTVDLPAPTLKITAA